MTGRCGHGDCAIVVFGVFLVGMGRIELRDAELAPYHLASDEATAVPVSSAVVEVLGSLPRGHQ
jgi:hypothetical protein